MRWLLPLVLLSACAAELAPEGAATAGQVTCGLAAVKGPREALVLVTPPSGMSSELRAVPLAKDGPQLDRAAVLATVDHAAGFTPTARVVGDSVLTLAIPPTGRRGSPATLTLDGRVLDDQALELQTPVLLAGCAAWLRGVADTTVAGPQPIDFELRTTLQDGPVFTTRATWLQVLGAAPHPEGPSLVLYELQSDGAALIELSLAGVERGRVELGSGYARELVLHGRGVDLLWLPAGQAVTVGLDGARAVLADGLTVESSFRVDRGRIRRERTDPLGRTNPIAVTPAGLVRHRFDPAGDRVLLDDRPLHESGLHGTWVGTR